jgi:hypothetical protein
MTLHKITELYTELFSVYHNITSKFRTIAILKTASNKIMIQIKLIGMSMISYYTKEHLSKYNSSWVVSTKQTMNFNIRTAAMFVFFVFGKNGLIKSCLSFEDLSVYKISWSHVDWWKFCIHLRSLNIRHFGIVKGTRLGVRRRGHLQWHDLPTEFHKNLPIVSKVIRGDTQIDRQTGYLMGLTFLKKEGRLKIHKMLASKWKCQNSNSDRI